MKKYWPSLWQKWKLSGWNPDPDPGTMEPGTMEPARLLYIYSEIFFQNGNFPDGTICKLLKKYGTNLTKYRKLVTETSSP